MVELNPLLEERSGTHGNFGHNAKVSQALKRLIRASATRTLNDTHAEAIDLICTKISRILSGKANFKDHWDDIVGYAKLGSEACE